MAKHSKKKGGFQFYHFLILVCIILIVVAVYIILKPECIQNIQYFIKPDTQITSKGIEVIKPKTSQTEKISEEEARTMATLQFRLLGEKGIKAKDLKITKIEREQVEYYYATSSKNTLEVSVIGGNIVRINSQVVEEN